ESSESVSGSGSEIKQTQTLVNELNKLFLELNIKSVLDLPCGDFKWMQKVDLSKIDYTGADIVEDLINNNKKKYQNDENIKFLVLNLITDSLPKSDLIIVRDCLVHLSFKDIHNAIKNIKNSGSKYLLTTTFTNYHPNLDIVTGNWRPLNLQEKPFNFSTPMLIINENCTEGNGVVKDKAMALWDINEI
ncbi:MAG: class I SAM-dependent methyltransferase, partial [Flavobacterium sp.]